jgi:hypothetical protein
MLDKPEPNDLKTSRSPRYDRGEGLPVVRSKIFCKNCKRRDFHYLDIRSTEIRLLVKAVTLGAIGLFGMYRCRCCGTRRIGRYDFLRGPEQPRKSNGILKNLRPAVGPSTSFQWEKRRQFVAGILRSLNPFSWIARRKESWKWVQRRERVRRFFLGLWPSRKRNHRRFKKRKDW